MSDEHTEGSFQEYRKLIIAHMESSNRRQRALEEALVEIRVQMGVLVVKVGLIVALCLLVGGTIATQVVSAAVKAAAQQVVEDSAEGK